MQALNFGKLQGLTKKNTRESSGNAGKPRSSGFAFSVNAKGVEKFQFSQKLFDSLNLNKNGFNTYLDDNENPTTLILITYPETSENVIFFTPVKKTAKNGKSKAVTSSLLKEQLIAVGLVKEVPVLAPDAKPVVQKLDLEKIENIYGTPSDTVATYKVILKVQNDEEDDSELESEEDEVGVVAEATITETPSASSPVADSEWD